jgi:transcriptional regulator with XRE-family HTH domain
MSEHWPQQGIFIRRVKEFSKENGHLTKRGAVKTDAVADLFGIQEDTLIQFMHDSKRKRPHIDTLTQIAAVLGVSVTEFMDAPSHPAPGVPNDAWAKMSEHERAIVVSMLADIASSDFTAAEKDELYRIFQEGKDRLVRLKKMWAAPPAKGE